MDGRWKLNITWYVLFTQNHWIATWFIKALRRDYSSIFSKSPSLPISRPPNCSTFSYQSSNPSNPLHLQNKTPQSDHLWFLFLILWLYRPCAYGESFSKSCRRQLKLDTHVLPHLNRYMYIWQHTYSHHPIPSASVWVSVMSHSIIPCTWRSTKFVNHLSSQDLGIPWRLGSGIVRNENVSKVNLDRDKMLVQINPIEAMLSMLSLTLAFDYTQR